MKKGVKEFSLRSLIFLIITFLLIPNLIKFFSNGMQRYPTVNLLGVDVFFYTMILIFIFVKRKEVFSSYNQNWKETLFFLVLSALSFLLYLGVGPFTQFLLNRGIMIPVLNYFLVYLTFFILEFFVFTCIFNISFIVRHKNYLILIVASSILFFLLSLFLYNHWFVFANFSTNCSVKLLGLFYDDADMIVNNLGFPVLHLKSFNAVIGPVCAGTDSIIMFLFLFGILLFRKWKTSNKQKAIIFLIAGCIGAFLINILRICLIMIVGTYDAEFALNSFHNNIGWSIFFIYFIAFVFFSFKFIRNQSLNK